MITHQTTLNMKIYNKIKKTDFLITGLGNQKIILGLPWLQDTNPKINWKNASLNWRTPIEDKPDREEHLNDTTNLIPNWYPTDSIIIDEQTISQLELQVKKMLGKNTTLNRPDLIMTDHPSRLGSCMKDYSWTELDDASRPLLDSSCYGSPTGACG